MAIYIDSHAHLTHETVYQNIDAILLRAKESGIDSIINICTDVDNLKLGLELSKRYPWIYNTAATTPHDVEKTGNSDFEFISECAKKKRLKAIGETGLDYYYEYSDRKVQKEFLIRYLHLAIECSLPIIIHCREAFHDLFQIIDSNYMIKNQQGPGVLHCFTGTINEAEEVIKRGWYISLSGIVTFKKSQALQEVAKIIPLERLLIETDTPYLAPQSKRGHPNEPSYVAETAAFIANLRNISIEEIAQATSKNAKKLFQIF